ncbi:unnamed protein product [Cuscuta campestris]|uniref:Reverse transcriptase zinc-binding domain-containing protein n=1 Tax=Cuscuta campestris TaxID=132261 RepID=A0A484MW69_9ASTE|nr:unnamed protein product [Cuscuta campestris]
MGNRTKGRVLRRLDRVLINQGSLDQYSDIYLYDLSRTSSDHKPLLLDCINYQFSGPRPFRYINAWALNESFYGMVKEAWNSNANGRGMRGLATKLKNLKNSIREWNHVHFGNIFTKVQEAEQAVLQAQESYETEDNIANREAFNLANANLLRACKIEETYWAQKANVKWIASGDASTKFFHSYVKGKRRKASIRLIRNQEGRELEDGDPKDIISFIVNHYEKEIKAAIWHLNPNSSAGPDGYNGDFFRKFWDIIKEDLISAVQDFFLGQPIPMAFGSTYIILIPKQEGAKVIGDYRPIALSTFFSKIISRILSNRLSPLLDKIISPEQAGFQKGKGIEEHIFLTNELMHRLESKGKLANFFWGTKLGKSKHHWAKWTALCKPTGEGGLGLRSLEDLQKACALKLWWKVINANSLWSNFVKDKYYRDGLFETKLYDSTSWKRICRISTIGLQNTSMISSTPKWINGKFTFKETYWAVRDRDISTRMNTLICNKFQIPKIKLFTWKAIHHFLPFPNILRKLSYNLPSKCPFCAKEEVTDQHILLTCILSQQIWKAFADYVGEPNWSQGTDLSNYMLQWWENYNKYTIRGLLKLILPGCIIWNL